MDHNKIQSSRYVKDIINLRDLRKKLSHLDGMLEQWSFFKDIAKNFKN